MTAPAPIVSMRAIVKRFGGARALDGVDFDVRAGEIHALLGENGAGKSTLMQILSGIHRPDSGEIYIDGKSASFSSAAAAGAAGIGMVHQHFMLVDRFTVAENLALALGDETPFLLPRAGLAQRALDVAAALGWKLEPNAPVWQLPVGVQQRIEIVKLLARDPRVLIFDEPTAVLAPTELDELFEVIRRLRADGRAIVFISHKLREVTQLCDRVTVLRRGLVSGQVAVDETSPEDLARRMVGDAMVGAGAKPPDWERPASGEAPLLEVRDLVVRGERGLNALQGVTLKIRPGEILGVAGVDGNGQQELAEAVAGLRPPLAGAILYEGKAIGPGGPPRRDLGYVPQDRRRDGLALSLPVRDNLILELHQRPEAAAGPLLRWTYLNRMAERMRQNFDVRTESLMQPASSLSGGNQQKIVIARALDKNPRLILALNPTRGVDVGATAYIHDRIREQARNGCAILLISTELDEVLDLADRVAVLYEGRIVGEALPGAPREVIGLMMGGHGAPDAAAV